VVGVGRLTETQGDFFALKNPRKFLFLKPIPLNGMMPACFNGLHDLVFLKRLEQISHRAGGQSRGAFLVVIKRLDKDAGRREPEAARTCRPSLVSPPLPHFR